MPSAETNFRIFFDRIESRKDWLQHFNIINQLLWMTHRIGLSDEERQQRLESLQSTQARIVMFNV